VTSRVNDHCIVNHSTCMLLYFGHDIALWPRTYILFCILQNQDAILHAQRGGAYLNTYEEGPRFAHIRIAMSSLIEPDVIIFWLRCVYQHKVNFGEVK